MPTDRTTGGLTWAGFIEKWSRTTLPERAASQEHFLDLCRLLNQPTPAEFDAAGTEYAFEKGVSVTGAASRGSKGDAGYADVWWRGKFAWEYKRKGKHKDLAEAYRQLCQYREDLENPPLLIVSDIARTEIHTNFTGFKPVVHTLPLAHIDHPDNIALLRRVFTDPGSFRPSITTEQVTKEIAEQIGRIAVSLQAAGHEPHAAAHFLMKCMFCLFAEDIGLLRRGGGRSGSPLQSVGCLPSCTQSQDSESAVATREGLAPCPGRRRMRESSCFTPALGESSAAIPWQSWRTRSMTVASISS